MATIPITIVLIVIWRIWLSWTEPIEGLQMVKRLAMKPLSAVKRKRSSVLFDGSDDGSLSVSMRKTADLI